MKELFKISLRFILKNKKRIAFSICGVVMAIILMSSVLLLQETLPIYQKEIELYVNGKWLMKDSPQYESMLEDTIELAPIKEEVTVSELGVSLLENGRFIELQGYSDFNEIYPLHIKEGRYPQSESELIVTEDYLRTHAFSIGDKVTLEVGNRFVRYGNDEIFQSDSSQMMENEYYRKDFVKDYVIVGTFEEPLVSREGSALAYRVVTKASQRGEYYTTYYTIDKIASNDWEEIQSTIRPQDMVYVNENALDFYIEEEKRLTFHMGFINVLIFSLIGLCVISLIKNMFDMFLKERIHLLGIMQCVGATPKQIRQILLMEALIIALVAIPLGLLLSYSGMALFYMGMSELQMKALDLPIPFHLVFRMGNIIFIVIVVLAVLMISAWLPIRKAFECTPIELIRNESNGVRIEKQNKLQKEKFLSVEQILGKRYHDVNKIAHKTIIFTMCMSILLFVSGNYYVDNVMDFLKELFTKEENTALEVMLKETTDIKNQDEFAIKDKLFAMNEKGENSYIFTQYTNLEIPKRYISDEIQQVLPNIQQDNVVLNITTSNQLKGRSKDKIRASVDAYVEVQNLDMEIFDVETLAIHEAQIITIPYTYVKNQQTYKNQVDFVVENRNEETDINKDRTVYFEGSGEIVLRINIDVSREDYQVLWEMFRKQGIEMISRSKVFLEDRKQNDVFTKLQDYTKKHSDEIEYVYDPLATKTIDTELLGLKIVLNAFTFFILIICIMNVLITVISSVIFRKREIGMLESVGMEDKQLFKMVFFENIADVVKSLMIGLPIAISLNTFLYVMKVFTNSEGFTINICQMIVIAGVVLFVGVLGTVVGWNMICKESVIEKIRKTRF